MRKYWFATILPLALVACSPESDSNGDGDDENNSSQLVIDSENKDLLVNQALSDFAVQDSFDDPFTEFSDLLIDGGDTGSRSSISARLQESVNCDSGSASVTANTSDIDTQPFPPNGNASFDASYNNCNFSESGQGYTFSMTIDGSMAASLDWTGYDSGSKDFDTYNMVIDIDDFSFVMNSNGQEFSFEMDFDASFALDNSIATYSYSGSFGIDDAGNGKVSIETLTPFVVDTSSSSYPTSGEALMNGGNGTSIRYTVVSNGIEVSVNGGQAELYEWSEIENM